MASLDLDIKHFFFATLGCAVVFWTCFTIYSRRKKPSSLPPTPPSEKHDLFDAYTNIEPLTNFDWRTTEPIQIRPFKPKYHLTMALENLGLSELVEMDNTYLERINIRSDLFTQHPDFTIACNPKMIPAVNEFYDWTFRTYLPKRFPAMFSLASTPTETYCKNLVNGHSINVCPPADPLLALRTLGEQVDTDFLFLLPSDKPEHDGRYVLEAYVNAFPAGFNTRNKLNLKLADIHAPVPHYSEKLEKSMDRFFASMPCGKIVRRVNWSITTTPDLFIAGGNHLYEDDDSGKMPEDEIEPEKCVMRAERQTLHRLPQTRALVFAFKTYQYPLSQIRDEGSGPALSEAIDGLGKGSAPKILYYKRGVVWGPKVKEYLKGS